MNIYYQCIKCQEIYPYTKDILTCKKHSNYYGYLTVVYDYKKIKKIKIPGKNTWDVYAPMLPIKSFPITYNEQKTPLFKLHDLGKKYGFTNLYVKDESKNPTGSFKDRGTFCTVNQAREWKIDNLLVVSSGNAALSTAAYARKANILCTCLVSTHTPEEKKFLIDLYNAKMMQIDGTYVEIFRKAIDEKFPGWNFTPGLNPIHEEGIKTISFEIWEDIKVPDAIIVPCGNGSLLYGIYKGFKELQYLGIIDKLPKLIGVQIKNHAPLQMAFKKKKDFVILKEPANSIADSFGGQESYSSPKVMLALNETKGEILEVTDDEIIASLKEIITFETLIPEPTSAAVYAALKKLQISTDAKIVAIQTATGVKNLATIMNLVQ